VDSRVDQSKHPDGRGHEAHASPHGQHGTSVVVLLESGAALALCENDGRVENLVELGEVEPPAPESKALVPDPANIEAVGEAIGCQRDIRVEAAPRVVGVVEGDGIAKSARAVDLAEGVNGANDGVGLAVVGEGALEAADHGHTGNGRVDGQEDVVEDDKGKKGTRFGDPPRLVSMLTVVPVDVGDGDKVDGGNGQRDLVGQRALVDVLGDGEWVCKGRLAAPRRWDRRGRGIGRKLEDGSRGPVARVKRGSCARHGGSVCGWLSYSGGEVAA
jgi:hypothetical protein